MNVLDDLPEGLDDLRIREGGYNDGHVRTSGIDIQKLNKGLESNFEIQMKDEQDDVPQPETNENQFNPQELFQQLNYECNDTEVSDPALEHLSPFERMKQTMEDISPVGDGGIMKMILKHGAGSVVPPRSLCRVHYNGYFEFNDEPFDSSRLRGRQHQFKLGEGEILMGWEIGIGTMKRGELARFIMTSQYAYGKYGCPPRIPKDATPMFEIELISFVDQGAADDYESFTEEERKKATFEEILGAVDALRKTGNEAFELNQVKRASTSYMRAIRLLENANLKNEYEEIEMKKSALKLYLNMALMDLKEAKSGRACKHARKALEIEPKNVKALYRLARALHQLGDLESAKKEIWKAHRYSPGNEEVMKEMRQLDNELARYKRKDQVLSRKMLNLDPMPKKAAAPKNPTPAQSQMLKMVLDRLKSFKNSSDLPEMRLPDTLTQEEVDSVKIAVNELDLFFSSTQANGQTMIIVSKTSLQEK